MAASLLGHSSDMSRRLSAGVENCVQFLSQPAPARRLRQGLLLLFCLWGVLALTRLIWALLPASDSQLPEAGRVINPVTMAAPAEGGPAVDVARVQGWHLFGEAGALNPAQTTAEPDTRASVREGIEKGARETRLNLKLRGVVASSEEGLGFAIIEQNSQQDIYAVEDKLPVQGNVTLAKVMRGRVVLDNGGTYELLELFDDSELNAQAAALPAPAPEDSSPTAIDRGDASASAVAQGYRDRLYENPQSLAEVVSVSAVRENGQLLGYRIAPGKEREQFELLGFQPGDLVTSVNGIALDDPANTLSLYQAMRSASEAIFELQRDGAPVTVSVSLGESSDGT
jgi:general secretion pathway protein C